MLKWPGVWLLRAVPTLVLLLGLLPGRVLAADIRNGEAIIIGADVTINDDLYAFGSAVTILGTVNGDVVTAGNAVAVSGTVNGSVIAAGSNVTISGRVTQSVRAAGGTVTVTGVVLGDVVAAGGTVTLGPGGSIGRDLLVGGAASVFAPIARNLLAGGETLTIAAPVGGDVRAEGARLTVAEGGSIAGGLYYTSDSDAIVSPGASVKGTTVRTPANRGGAVERQPTAADALLGWLRGLVGLSALGLLFVLGLPRLSRRATGTMRTSPGRTLATGAALFVGAPLVALAVTIIGVLLGGWWLGLGLFCLYALSLPLALVATAYAAGLWVLERANRSGWRPAWTLLLGVGLLSAMLALPVFGAIIGLLATIAGLGALWLSAGSTIHSVEHDPWGAELPVARTAEPAVAPAPLSPSGPRPQAL